MTRTRAAAVGLIAMTLAAGGCGKATKSLTQAEMIAKADPICGRINAKISYYSNLKPANSQDLVSASAIVQATPQIASAERAAYADLAKLTPPASMADDWKQFLEGVKTIADDTARVGDYAKAKNTAPIAPIMASASTTLQRLRATATRHGFDDCAKIL